MRLYEHFPSLFFWIYIWILVFDIIMLKGVWDLGNCVPYGKPTSLFDSCVSLWTHAHVLLYLWHFHNILSFFSNYNHFFILILIKCRDLSILSMCAHRLDWVAPRNCGLELVGLVTWATWTTRNKAYSPTQPNSLFFSGLDWIVGLFFFLLLSLYNTCFKLIKNWNVGHWLAQNPNKSFHFYLL